MPRKVRSRLDSRCGSRALEFVGPEWLAQTEVRQNGGHYNRSPNERKGMAHLSAAFNERPEPTLNHADALRVRAAGQSVAMQRCT